MTERNGLDVAQFELGAGGYEFDIDGAKVTATLDSGYAVDESAAASSVSAAAVIGHLRQGDHGRRHGDRRGSPPAP